MPYETTPIGQWDVNCWIEFYRFLETTPFGQRGGFGTAEVPIGGGKAGGIIMYTCFWYPPGCKTVYLDIQPKPFNSPPDEYLNFRVEVDKDLSISEKEAIINDCVRRIQPKTIQMGGRIIAPPPYLITGGQLTDIKTVRFAVVGRVDWLGGDGEIINRERVVENLRVYEMVLEEYFADR